MCEKRLVSENLLLFAFLYFTSNFDIIPYKSYPNNDMGCKSRPKLGFSQLTPDYANSYKNFKVRKLIKKNPAYG